jgi:hypothetical protein
MLLNLEYSVQCDAFVGTLPSNWCRLTDELRATVGNDNNDILFLNIDKVMLIHLSVFCLIIIRG